MQRAPCSREPGAPSPGPAAENTSFHWHKTHDTEEARLNWEHGKGGLVRRVSGKSAAQTFGLSAIYLDRVAGIVAFCVPM